MKDVDVAIAVAQAGASVVRRRFGTHLRRVVKVAGDFATDVDVEAEEVMLAVLRGQRPHEAIVGEERGRSGRRDRTRTWLIDPLCGTLNYAARTRLAAVNVALQSPACFMAAAVADVFDEEVLWSDGRAVFRRAGDQEMRVTPYAGTNLVDLNSDPPFPSAPAFRAVRLAADDEFTARFKPRVLSTSLALAWVATGQRAAYVTDGTSRDSVHFAAGLALCEAAGCPVTDLQGHAWRDGGYGLIAAADEDTHAALLEFVRKVQRARAH